MCVPRCGSFASSGLPVALNVPSTTQLFDPNASKVPPSRRSRTNGLPDETALVTPAAQLLAIADRSAIADLPPSRLTGASASLAGAFGTGGKVGTTWWLAAAPASGNVESPTMLRPLTG